MAAIVNKVYLTRSKNGDRLLFNTLGHFMKLPVLRLRTVTIPLSYLLIIKRDFLEMIQLFEMT